ncbi:unnamed protein product [Polarella glacialis]|uniref:Uncharacterized protein n=1 Tax=Polarella glacialis TaxID=89957 RepID=A0A813I5G0_POLGL|nr:unnamed protein product [Polarella glacialis]
MPCKPQARPSLAQASPAPRIRRASSDRQPLSLPLLLLLLLFEELQVAAARRAMARIGQVMLLLLSILPIEAVGTQQQQHPPPRCIEPSSEEQLSIGEQCGTEEVALLQFQAAAAHNSLGADAFPGQQHHQQQQQVRRWGGQCGTAAAAHCFSTKRCAKLRRATLRCRSRTQKRMKSRCLHFSYLFMKKCPTACHPTDRWVGISAFEPQLWIFNSTSGSAFSVNITLDNNGPVEGGNGLALDPLTGVSYAVLKVPGLAAPANVSRILASIDLLTGSATYIGDLGEFFAGLAFAACGTLYGVTGDCSRGDNAPCSGGTPSTLFTIDTKTACPTFFVSLGAGGDGEAIAFNSENGLMYHWSGNNINRRTLDTINLATKCITDITSSRTAPDREVLGAGYACNGDFVLTDRDSRVTTWNVDETFSIVALPRYLDLRGVVPLK